MTGHHQLKQFVTDRLSIEPLLPIQRVENEPRTQIKIWSQCNEIKITNLIKVMIPFLLPSLIFFVFGLFLSPYLPSSTGGRGAGVVSYDPSFSSSKAAEITNQGKSCLQRHEVMQIGGTLSLTGKHEEIGKDYHQGFNLCADHINAGGGLLGKPVVFIIEHDQSEGDVSRNLYQKLITEEKVDLVSKGKRKWLIR